MTPNGSIFLSYRPTVLEYHYSSRALLQAVEDVLCQGFQIVHRLSEVGAKAGYSVDDSLRQDAERFFGVGKPSTANEDELLGHWC